MSENKLSSFRLTKEMKEEVKQKQQEHSHKAITDLKQVEKLKKQLIDSGFIEGQDFRVEDHEIITGTASISFWIREDKGVISITSYSNKRVEHEYVHNYYSGSIQLLWKDVTKTHDYEEDQFHITSENPKGWRIWDRQENLRLTTERYRSGDNKNYYGKYGNYSSPLTIQGSREFCKNYRDLRATTYLKRMREFSFNAQDILADKIASVQKYLDTKSKIEKAKKGLTTKLTGLFLRKINPNKTAIIINFYNSEYRLDIFFPDGDSDYRGDTITIEYNPDSYECSILKVTNDYGFISWSELHLIQEVHEGIEA